MNVVKKVIGIDLGGTKINGGIIDENGQILKKITIKTEAKNGRKKVLDNLKKVISLLIKGCDVEGIGVGSPGFIDFSTGEVLFLGGNIPDWTGVNIKKELDKSFEKVPIYVENDANVAALCESWVGSAKNLNSFVMITLGTGVGGGIWTKKAGIWRGNNYQGGEFGHSILYPDGIKCGCGQRGCAEQYISGNAIQKNYYRITSQKLKAEEIFQKSYQDLKCKQVVDKFIKDLSCFLISLKNIFDTQGIIIGGGVINSKEYWWDDMVKYFKINCNNIKDMTILPARYLNDAGMIGSAKMVFDDLKLNNVRGDKNV